MSRRARSLLTLYRQLARTQSQLAVREGAARWYREEIIRLKLEIHAAEAEEKRLRAVEKDSHSAMDSDLLESSDV